jgi:hypothetical protein
MSAPNIDLTPEMASAIRRALAVGLTCFGQIEQAHDMASLMKNAGDHVPPGLLPRRPTGSCDVASTFAEALSYLD